jgi:flavin reductase (DIM6/NTAB) family NADH-FMN oxidoreductase RutF
MTGFASTEFRSTVGTFATGVTVITTRGEQHPYGMTANAFSSLSLDPPLILVCIISRSEGMNQLSANGCFAVNILAADQEPLSRYFASRDRPKGRDAFEEVPHRTAQTGSPILEGALGYLDCTVQSKYESGDHHIFIGEVLDIGYDPEGVPLLFHGGRYRGVHDV